MTNDVFVDDKKIKDILNFIKSMKHAEQIRMMFLCSLNGMRSINFAYLQIKDIFTFCNCPRMFVALLNKRIEMAK